MKNQKPISFIEWINRKEQNLIILFLTSHTFYTQKGGFHEI